MRSLGLVELKRTCKRLEDALGDAGGVAALELRVISNADAGEQRNLFPSQARNPARAMAVGAQTGVFRGDAGPSRGKELAHLAPGVHVGTVAPPALP